MSALATSKLFPADPIEQIRAVESGLSVSRFAAFRKTLNLSSRQLAELLGISESTLLRLGSKPTLPPVVSDRAWRLWNVRSKAVALFEGDTKAADRWLAAPQFAFAGRTPLALMVTEAGAREVEALAHRMEHGVVA